MSFHNLKMFLPQSVNDSKTENDKFDKWLIETCSRQGLSLEEREQRLIDWEMAPSARFCHPREEHLLPLHVCCGIACVETPIAKIVFNKEVMGRKVTGFHMAAGFYGYHGSWEPI